MPAMELERRNVAKASMVEALTFTTFWCKQSNSEKGPHPNNEPPLTGMQQFVPFLRWSHLEDKVLRCCFLSLHSWCYWALLPLLLRSSSKNCPYKSINLLLSGLKCYMVEKLEEDLSACLLNFLSESDHQFAGLKQIPILGQFVIVFCYMCVVYTHRSTNHHPKPSSGEGSAEPCTSGMLCACLVVTQE